MDFFLGGLTKGLGLLAQLDPEVYGIAWLSLRVSLSAVILAALAAVPLGLVIGQREFPGKRFLVVLFNTLLALPTVVIGLFVYAFISRRGILGPLDLLYSQSAIIIGQVMLVAPIVVTFTIAAISRIDDRYRKTAMTLGATGLQTAGVVFREARFGLVAAVTAAFGRVIAEVGVSMMLGGNIKGFTRTMTTAMALEYDKGEFVLAVALGIVLMVISFTLNIALGWLQGRTRT